MKKEERKNILCDDPVQRTKNIDEFVKKFCDENKELMEALANDTPCIDTEIIKCDEQLLKYIEEMKKIYESNDKKGMLYDYGRIYNDAMNYIVVTYQVDGLKACEIIDELLNIGENKDDK